MVYTRFIFTEMPIYVVLFTVIHYLPETHGRVLLWLKRLEISDFSEAG